MVKFGFISIFHGLYNIVQVFAARSAEGHVPVQLFTIQSGKRLGG